MASFQSLPLSIKYSKFLGLEDRIIIAGNDVSGNGQVQILVNIDSNNESTSSKYELVALSSLSNNKIISCELGCIPSESRTFLVLSCQNAQTGISSIALAHILSSYSDVRIETLPIKNTESHFVITSLSYHSDHEAIAASREDGTVTVYNIYTGQEISSYNADAAGVNKVHYLKSGYIATTGMSTNSSILKIWDLRMNNTGVLRSKIPSQQYQHTLPKSEIGDIISLVNHPVNDQLVSGSSRGIVTAWDLRSAAHFSFLARGKVTDLEFHARQYDTILSSSNDGTVRITDTRDCDNYKNISNHPNAYLYQLPFETLAEETDGSAYMVSVDSIYGRNMYSKSKGLATSSVGGLWTFDI